MLSPERASRFRNLSRPGLARLDSSSFFFDEKDHEEHRDPEKECFMCRQANVYLKPIGMQHERRVARRHPPLLTRTQIEELSQKEKLTRKETRKLLQCYFPEIKNVKYFQLHKYHSCCYDPKHINLCKNHITALQHEREYNLDHESHRHETDEDHYRIYERDDGYQNRVSFLRIKIEPTKGIPTRFLAPAALPESLANMLIKQVNRLEDKKKPPSFGPPPPAPAPPPPQNTAQSHRLPKLDQSYEHGISSVTEYLSTLASDDDDDDDGNNDDSDDSDKDDNRLGTVDSGFHGYNGNILNRSLMQYENKMQVKQEKEKVKEKEKSLKRITKKEVVVEDLADLSNLFVSEQEPSVTDKPIQPLKKKKRKKRTKPRPQKQHKPKLNHWEIMALEQSNKEACGCRHHVRRIETNQATSDWCRCKDHEHKELKEKQKFLPPISPTDKSKQVLSPILSPPENPKPIPSTPKLPKIQKRTISINTTEPATAELALAYDPSAVDYDVIKQALYYRTSSGRLVKPEITNSFTYDNIISSADFDGQNSLLNKTEVVYTTPRDQFQSFENHRNHQQKHISPPARRLTLSHPGSASNSQVLSDNEVPSASTKTDEEIHVYKASTPSKTIPEEIRDDSEVYSSAEHISTKPSPERPVNSPVQSPIIPMSQQKSSKPTYVDQRPTPNFERESSIVANRRWFDQPLGDENLLPVHDGRYGLIAGTSTDDYILNAQLPDNDYVEPDIRRNQSNCTIS